MKTKLTFWVLLSLFSFLLATTSCKKDLKDTPAPAVQTSKAYAQEWIYNNMKYWYYWSSQITANPDTTLDSEPFFYSLLYKGTNGDRFSWIEPDYTTLVNQLNGVYKEAGYDFKLYLADPGSSDVIGQVTYIKKGSPAETAGLKRGDIFPEINETQITTTNYHTLLNATNSAYTLRVKRYDADTREVLSDQVVSLNPVQFSENPVLMDTVYTFADKKVGYMVYNFFSPGLNNSKTYDNEVDNIYAKFKSNGVNEVVLDLRFNGGGAISSAINLASLMVPAYTASKIFVNYQYNDRVQADIIKEPTLGESYLHQKFVLKSGNIGDKLTRIFVLTSNGTASASELIINGLKPYMEVVQVGDTTYGKNVGSITITDTKNTSNTLGMQPIVLKLTNSLGNSDYTNGFAPDPTNFDSDNYFYLRPLGDIREPLLRKALMVITNGSMKSAERLPTMAGKEIKGANLLNPYKTTMYLGPEMSPFK